MKTTILCSALMLLCASSVSFAQSCASPASIAPNGPFNGTTGSFAAGNPGTCTEAGNVQPLSGLVTICGGIDLSGPSYVYTWTVNGASPRSGSITVTPSNATFNVALFVLKNSCNSAGSCGTGTAADSLGAGGAETVALTAAGFAGAGTYYMLVTSTSDGSAAQGDTCGPFTGSMGAYPVTVQSFSVD